MTWRTFHRSSAEIKVKARPRGPSIKLNAKFHVASNNSVVGRLAKLITCERDEGGELKAG